MKTIFQHPLVIEALDFAIRMHDGQTRKDGSTLYITHPIGVAALVDKYGGNINQIVSAILHDVVEDCDCNIEQIENKFGSDISKMVSDLTNTSKQDFPEMNRASRKEFDAKRLAEVDLETQLVKFCDIYYNISDLIGLNPGFRIKFLKEKKQQVLIMSEKWNEKKPNSYLQNLRTEILTKIDDYIK